MSKVYVEDLSKHVGQEVRLHGWLYNKRSSGKIRFLLLRDGTGVVQGVMAKGAVADATFESGLSFLISSPRNRLSRFPARSARMTVPPAGSNWM